jgi:transglutaminase-like putative cysteine protease
MMPLAWKWVRRNFTFVLLLSATVCLVVALGEVVRGVTWSWLMPVSLLAVACGWGIGGSRLNAKQAWVSLIAVGVPGVFIYVAGLALPIGRLVLAMLSLIPQLVLWISEGTLIDFTPLLAPWADLSGHIASVLTRTWEWCAALFAGRTVLDPIAAGLVWNLLLWLVSAWAGWYLRRNRQALPALAPGGIVLALVLDYTRGEIGLVVTYLAILLTLMGLARNEWIHVQWRLRKVDYSESVALDTLVMVGMVTTALVLSAAGTPSISWRDLVDKLREPKKGSSDRVAESLGLEAPLNVATSVAYRADGLPRQHLLDTPPDQLQNVVFTVSTGELPPIAETVVEIHPNRYYWRAITYDVYSGGGWGSSSAQEVLLPANTPLLESPQNYRLVNQHIQRSPDQGTYVYWAGSLAQADANIEVAWRIKPPPEPSPAHNGDMLGALTDLDEYTIVSYVPQLSAGQLRAAGSDYPPEILARYLGLPVDLPERVLALARKLTQAAPTPYDRAVAIESYLRTFPYTLEVAPPPPGRDVVDYFLFSAQQGYCDYYATSMVVLARAAGLPARLVVGYANGDYNSPTAEYIVRQKHAHSWAEIYFSGIGWVEFEPTAGQPSIIRAGGESASGPPPDLPVATPLIAWLKASWRGLLSSLGGQLAIAGIGLILLLALWQAGELGFLHLIPSKMAISRMYARMEKVSARLLPDLPDGHTPYQLQTALIHKLKGGQGHPLKAVFSAAESEIERVVALHVAQVFSQYPPTRPQISQGIRAWLRLRWRLWVAKRWMR